ncbi:MAG: protein kinase [Cytophagaceae bacterium]|nr:protein kinase [Gemmatimonadaceae bacterium]
MNLELLQELQEVVGDAYLIERELGGGGMARVFLATERSLGRRVVIKVLPPDLVSGVSRARFEREILVTANLQHPHILPVLACAMCVRGPGSHDDLHYYITPYIEGESLRTRIALEGALPTRDALQILRELAGALAYAHSHGIIHRDVKPENVLLSGGHAVLADFGIASALQRVTVTQRLTATGQGPGTPGYMAPEQLVDANGADPRVDVFALGVVGFELLTGKAPFGGATPQALAASYFAEAPPSLANCASDVPAGVSAAISKAMATRPEDRFVDANEFLAALRAAEDEVRPSVLRRWKTRGFFAGATAAVALMALFAWRSQGKVSRAAAEEPGRKMVAVLPFKNLGAPDDAYFADGVTEEVTSRLASLPGLGVISRTSADQYAQSTKTLKQIAEELGADYVLEGSVRWQRTPGGGGRVRVTPQLIRVSDDSHLWAHSFDADLKDVFSVQSEIAEKVAGQLAVALPGGARLHMSARPTEDLAAYDAYIRAEQIRTREMNSASAMPRAEKLLLEAVGLDAHFALAFSRLALVHMRMYEGFIDRTAPRLAQARAAADSAIALDPSLPEAHLALGRFFEGTENLAAADSHYTIAIKGRPNDSFMLVSSAAVASRRGDLKEAVNRLRKAARLDPRSVIPNVAAAEAYGLMRDYTQAKRYLDRAMAADSDIVDTHVMKLRLEVIVAADYAAARETARGMLRRFGPERSVGSEGFDVALPALDSTDLVALERVTASAFGGSSVLYHYWRVHLYDTWRPQLAKVHADSLRAMRDDLVKAQPNSYRLLMASGWVSAVNGDTAVSRAHMLRSLELAPREKDAVAWSEANYVAAQTSVKLGDHARAIALLAPMLRVPSWVTVPNLRRDPQWEPLRTNPEFRKLVGTS